MDDVKAIVIINKAAHTFIKLIWQQAISTLYVYSCMNWKAITLCRSRKPKAIASAKITFFKYKKA